MLEYPASNRPTVAPSVENFLNGARIDLDIRWLSSGRPARGLELHLQHIGRHNTACQAKPFRVRWSARFTRCASRKNR
jgi:hypothetical protein